MADIFTKRVLMVTSAEESIKHIKAEIIAQDWRISPKRSDMIGTSLSCLQQHFADKKATHAMLTMAMSVLDYIRNNKGAPPETIDFIKESMAHVVEQYENLQYDPKEEEKVFTALFHRFNHLKKRIKEKTKGVPPVIVCSGQPAGKPSQQKDSITVLPGTIGTTEKDVTKKLLADLHSSLEKAGEAGSAIRDLLNELLARKAFGELTSSLGNSACLRYNVENEIKSPSVSSLSKERDDLPKETTAQPLSLTNAPPITCQQINIGKTKLALLTNSIAAHKTIKRKKLTAYVNDNKIPLNFFSRSFSRLSHQFRGPLSKISSQKLKKTTLPIIIPQWIGMPGEVELADSHLLVISNGNWHGIIVCSEVDQHPCNMVEFTKEPNGDIIGTGYLQDNSRISLLDSGTILKREGFLLIP